MDKEIPSTAYHSVHHLLVQHFNQTTDRERFQWLETDTLFSLTPHLIRNQSAIKFAHDLLRIAYLERSKTTDTLRALLLHLRQTYIGFSEICARLNTILDSTISGVDLGRLLFPAGVPDVDDPTLLRARALFQGFTNVPEELLPSVRPLPPPHHMRLDRNIDFVGREQELRDIARAIKHGRGAVVAAGIGGVGKTQTAIEWVHRYGQFFAGGVFWLDFRDADTARLSIATAGIAYGWEAYNALDLDTQIAKVRNQWNEPIPTLLVFDNCEEITLAYEYLPVGSGAKVLLTSRNTTWQVQVGNRGIEQVEIITLPRLDSITLLQKVCPSLSNAHANDIALAVGDLPLALHLAGSYLGKYQSTSFGNPVTYLESLKANVVNQLESSAARLKRRPSPTDHTLSVRATFDLSWERLRAQEDSISELAERLLGLLAQFAPGVAIPKAWLWVELTEGADEQDAIDALELLQSSGFLERVQSGEVRLHRLITDMVKIQQSEQAHTVLAKQANRVLSQVSPTYGTLDYIAQMDGWLPHTRHCRDYALQRRDEEGARLLNSLGVRLIHLAQYKEALHHLTNALEIRKAVLGERHSDTASSLNNLGYLYQVQGAYGHALPLLEEALAIYRAVLGEGHSDTASSLNNLAMVYYSQGTYQRALPLYEEALAIRREVLGEGHSDTASSLNNLAMVYYAQGAYGRALPLLEEALAIYWEILGEWHPDTAQSLNNLAMVYYAQGAYGRALPLYEEALAIRREVLGKRHPDTAQSLNNLAGVYHAIGAYGRALPLYEEALAITQEVLGEEHPDTASSLNNLGHLYQVQGAYGRALPLYEEALAIRKTVLGERHPGMASSLNNLAGVYYAQGAYERALPLYEEALAIRREVLGKRHPDTAQSLNNLGYLYDAQGEYGRALPLYEEALAIRREVLGKRHPYTASSLNNLAGVYHALGAYERALPLLEEALAIHREVLGKQHPDTATSLNNLAGVYESQGKYERALPLYDEALAIIREVLGERHPDTATSLNNLAGVCESQGKYERALPLYEEALTTLTTVLGFEHPNTIIVRKNRDRCLQMLENHSDLSE